MNRLGITDVLFQPCEGGKKRALQADPLISLEGWYYVNEDHSHQTEHFAMGGTAIDRLILTSEGTYCLFVVYLKIIKIIRKKIK